MQRVNDKDLDNFLAACKGNSFDKLQEQVNNIYAEGYSVIQFIKQLLDKVITMTDISDIQKAKITIKMAEVDSCLVEGASELLQLLDLGSYLLQVFCK